MVSIHQFKMKIPLISENLEMMERDLQKFQTFRVFPKYFSNLFITQYNNQLTYFTSNFNGREVHLVLYGQVRSVSERPNLYDEINLYQYVNRTHVHPHKPIQSQNSS